MNSRKSILLVGAGPEQVPAITTARELGLYTISCDGNPNAPGLALADRGYHLDIRHTEQLTELARTHQVSGIFCHAVEMPDIISTVATSLGLPTVDPAAAQRATDKYTRLAWFKRQGVPSAQFAFADRASDLKEAAREIGYPLVIKPTDTAGARGVQRVDSAAGLEPAYNEALRYSRSTRVLLEEFLEGPEISTEAVVYQGEIVTFAFADRNYEDSGKFSPYFVEDGINFPSRLSPAMQEQAIAVANQAICALGINFGAAKGDLIIHKGQVKVIEMAARTSGGWFGAGSIKHATGVDVLKPLIQMAVGNHPDLSALIPKQQRACAQRYLIPTAAGTVVSVSGEEAALSSPGLAHATFNLPTVGTVVSRATNHQQRFGQVICLGETLDEAIRSCKNALAKVTIELSPP